MSPIKKFLIMLGCGEVVPVVGMVASIVTGFVPGIVISSIGLLTVPMVSSILIAGSQSDEIIEKQEAEKRFVKENMSVEDYVDERTKVTKYREEESANIKTYPLTDKEIGFDEGTSKE